MQRERRRTNRDDITKTGYFRRTFRWNDGNETYGEILEQVDRFIVTALDKNGKFIIVVLAFVLAWIVWTILAAAFAKRAGMGTTIIRSRQIAICYCVQNCQQNDEIPDEIGIAIH